MTSSAGPHRPRKSAPREPKVEGEDRLQKILAHAGVGSRRACEEMILQGRVTVEGKVVKDLATRVDPAKVAVTIDGQRVQSERMVYFAVNKPKGYVSTNNDPTGRPRVVDLLPEIPQRVYTVGRLDEMSVGLMLLTNDGELANKLSHPKFGVEKVYRVVVAGAPSQEVLDKLIEGVWLAEGKVRARRIKAIARKGEATVLDMVLAEGKNREVRRMLAKLGHKVMALTRVAIGPITLKGLDPGAFRTLRFDEVELLRRVGDGLPIPGLRFGERKGAKPFAPRPSGVGRPQGPGPRSRPTNANPAPAQDRIGPPPRPTGPASRPSRPSEGPPRSSGHASASGPPPRRAGGPPPRPQNGPAGGPRRAPGPYGGPSGPPSGSPPRRAGGPPPRPQNGPGGPRRAPGPQGGPGAPRGGSRRPPIDEPPMRRIIGMGHVPQGGPVRVPPGPPPSQRRPPQGQGQGQRPDQGPPPRRERPATDQGRDRDRDRGRGGPPPQGRGRQGHDQGQGPLPQRRQGGQGRDQGPGQNQGGPRRPEPPPRREPPAPPSRPTLTVFDESSASGPPSRRPAPRARPQIGSRPMPKAKRPRPRPTEGGGPSDE